MFTREISGLLITIMGVRNGFLIGQIKDMGIG